MLVGSPTRLFAQLLLSLGLGLGYSSGDEPNSESDVEDELVFTRYPILMSLVLLQFYILFQVI